MTVMKPIQVQSENGKSVEHYEIVDTGWREDGLLAVILGAEEPALLESDHALEFARIVARRRRHSILATAEPVEAGTGQYPYQRTYCFS